MRKYAGIEVGDDCITEEATILNFWDLLEGRGLTEAIVADVNAQLANKGITLHSGTLVDATIIDAKCLIKNKARTRNPEMSSTKRGNGWYFGIKAHVSADFGSGTVHSLEAKTAKVNDSRVWDELLHGEEIDQIISKVRAKDVHPFRFIKRQFAHMKTRYRERAKNRAHLFTVFVLCNLFLVQRRLHA